MAKDVAFPSLDPAAAVANVWAEMVPDTPFAPSLTWRDAGVDSLKTLLFLLRLEEVLQRKIALDLVTLDTSLADLIRELQADASPIDHSVTSRPVVFLFPGVGGDEPSLAQFRASLAGEVAFVTLEPAGLETPAKLLADFDATLDRLVDEIEERQPTGPLHLAGYSLGGVQAFQAASQLAARGREVALVCLLDTLVGFNPALTPRTPPPRRPPVFLRPEVWGRFWPQAGETPLGFLDRAMFSLMIRTGRFEWARRLAIATTHRHGVPTNAERRRRVLANLRQRAASRWRPQRCEAPVLLLAGDDFTRYCRTDAWAQLAPNLTVHRIPGGHTEIFDPPGLAAIRPALLAALDAA